MKQFPYRNEMIVDSGETLFVDGLPVGKVHDRIDIPLLTQKPSLLRKFLGKGLKKKAKKQDKHG